MDTISKYEKILCYKANVKEGIHDAVEVINKLKEHYYVRKEIAEKNIGLKQIVCYCILRHGSNIYGYYRDASEDRLRGNFSIGWGGHVNELDSDNSFEDILYISLSNCITRELREEIGFVPENISLKKVLYSTKSEVDKMHLGFIFVSELTDKEEVKIKEISNLYVGQSPIESWSKILIQKKQL